MQPREPSRQSRPGTRAPPADWAWLHMALTRFFPVGAEGAVYPKHGLRGARVGSTVPTVGLDAPGWYRGPLASVSASSSTDTFVCKPGDFRARC